MADAYRSVLVRQINKTWESLLLCHTSWNILRDQGFLLLQSLVNDHLNSIPDPSANDIEKILTKFSMLIQRMQSIHLTLLQIKADASARLDATDFMINDHTIDQWIDKSHSRIEQYVKEFILKETLARSFKVSAKQEGMVLLSAWQKDPYLAINS